MSEAMKTVVDDSWTWNFSKRWELGGRKIAILCSPVHTKSISKFIQHITESSHTCIPHTQILTIATEVAVVLLDSLGNVPGFAAYCEFFQSSQSLDSQNNLSVLYSIWYRVNYCNC